MARRKVLDLDADQTVKFEEKGQEFAGYYIGSKKVKSDFGFSLLHVFQAEDKSTVGIWGSSKLDSKLGSVQPGEMTYITYLGKVKIPGGKTMHKYDVDADDELKIDVGSVTINYENSEEPTDDEVGTGLQAEAGATPADGEIDEDQAAEEDDATENEDEDAALVAKTPKAPKTLKTSAPKTLTPQPNKATADKVSSMLSKRR